MILYKLGQNGMLFWEGIVNDCTLSIFHGLLQGQKQTETLEFSTNAEATIERLRRYNKKRDREGYTETQPTDYPPFPMLATSFQEHGSKLPLQVHVQAKLDGMRCIGSCDGLFTRRNDVISSMPHVSQALKSLPPGIVLDGELYSPNHSFQEILSMVKRHVPTNDGINSIGYYVFDIITDSLFEERVKEYHCICDMIGWPLIPVASRLIKKADAESELQNAIEHGFEGVMLRDPSSHYEPSRRSYALQKYKSFYTAEYQIIDIVAAKSGREMGAAIYVLATESGLKFKARPKLTLPQRCLLYRNSQDFIGYWTRITYQSLSSTGIPRQPIAEGLEPNKEALN